MELFSKVMHLFKSNTQIYNLIFVPQITRFLVGDAIISSKADPLNGRRKENRSYGKVKNNKTMLKLLPFIRVLYLNQQSSILWCFCRLKPVKKHLFNNTFFSLIVRSKMMVHKAEKNQIKYSAQNYLDKIAFFYVQTAAWLSCCCHKLLFQRLGNCRALRCITIGTTSISSKHHLNNL